LFARVFTTTGLMRRTGHRDRTAPKTLVEHIDSAHRARGFCVDRARPFIARAEQVWLALLLPLRLQVNQHHTRFGLVEAWSVHLI
jgi:hypothetical protein